MKEVDKLVYTAGEITSYIRQYVDAKLGFFKLVVIEKSSRSLASIAYRASFLVVGALFIIFISLTAAFYLSQLLESQATGFGLVTAFYALLALLLFLFGKQFKTGVANVVIGDLSKALDYEYEEFEEYEEHEK